MARNAAAVESRLVMNDVCPLASEGKTNNSKYTIHNGKHRTKTYEAVNCIGHCPLPDVY